MILVDSSVWIDFFRGVETARTRLLEEGIRQGSVVVADLVLVEVLQGFTSDSAFQRARERFSTLRVVAAGGVEIALAAAKNHRHLRSRGVTVRKTIDTLIATRCIMDDLPLLYSDRDFDPFVTHLGLRSALPGLV